MGSCQRSHGVGSEAKVRGAREEQPAERGGGRLEMGAGGGERGEVLQPGSDYKRLVSPTKLDELEAVGSYSRFLN